MDPTSGEIPRLLLFREIRKSHKLGLKFQGRVILKKKAPARNAPVAHRMGFYQNPQISQFPKFKIRIFQILDAKQSKIKSHIAVLGKVSELAIKKRNHRKRHQKLAQRSVVGKPLEVSMSPWTPIESHGYPIYSFRLRNSDG